MKKYEVTLYYHTSVTVEVEASTKQGAIGLAYCEAGDKKYDQVLLQNLQSDGAPDVIELLA